ncbi:hypothetical protein K505DRAFT_309557 [Melanomma pulvis-pyrius CBS 109.77]|uniref:Uncharacterized protein n=1 Tax=Melanomma pulvis-pyrius CBS 109.77 TaxID=1314802 RepID=A0A6A6X5I7_9PLEO|nr:hypothetical protein K505DRAFT_309557 [Melanomma pulvis-pyrius CBS 109.77]
MAHQLQDCLEAGGGRIEERGRPATIHSHSDPTPTRLQSLKDNERVKESSSGEPGNVICEPTLLTFLQKTHSRVPIISSKRQSCSTTGDSPTPSRPNSPFESSVRPGVLSTATSATTFTIDTQPELSSACPRRRPSILTRLKSSISTSSPPPNLIRRTSIHPSDFQIPPEHPEKHFIDSVGMVIPGVTNRRQCDHPIAHFITNWRLCEPIEYTTALADHGITYTDYCRLNSALEDFLDGIPNEPKRRTTPKDRWWSLNGWQSDDSGTEDGLALQTIISNDSIIDSTEQFKRTEHHAADLIKLLAEISENWRARGLPVMVCISSFSLFAPNRISESHVQILHVSLHPSSLLQKTTDHRFNQGFSFADSFSEAEECSVSVAHPKVDRRSTSPHSSTSAGANGFHHYQCQLKDRTRPWPLWPNAIPSRKRELMNRHSDRYGVDPYFRAYMRANINSRTKSSSYAKYMIEQEDNPFINTRLEYANAPSRIDLAKSMLSNGFKSWKEQFPSTRNRDNYEHNRRLECRKTVEHGSRLRITRFGFQHPIYPPHTPEMNELGLSKESYHTIISDIDDLRRSYSPNPSDCAPSCIPWLRHIRKRSADEALTKVSEYIRHVNAQQRGIVWTIEKIPGVYESELGRNGKEWEISAWNGEDPLELLIQLERWGIIEKKLNIDDDDMI